MVKSPRGGGGGGGGRGREGEGGGRYRLAHGLYALHVASLCSVRCLTETVEVISA